MNKKYLIYLVILGGILLMGFNISELDFSNLQKGPFSGIISNVLLILAMIILLIDLNKNKEMRN
ncbi:hypothetical protein [Ancylomarina sp.]|uniref:hypothetical protein n=1 Tax=Ancylomarina sp. TaxID=1970196 RepID=UPI0035633F29